LSPCHLASFRNHLVIIVAVVVEAAAGVVLLRSRAEGFREQALYHASEAGLFQNHARLWDQAVSEGCTEIPPDATPEEYARGAARCRRRAAYEAALSEKYQHAAARPWLPVAADPPTPD
jgi:hypothetical protein